MNILVLAGGYSPERDVSLASGCLIANALMKNGWNVALADVFEDTDPKAEFHAPGTREYSYTIPETEPDLEALRRKRPGNALIGRGVTELAARADVVFLALHGGMGENGQLQATLDTFGIRYTGSGYEGCVLAMNKSLTKKLLDSAGIRTPRSLSLESGEISYPCFVKPSGCGSSVGVSRAETREELSRALKAAGAYGQEVLVEELIRGREFSVGVLDGHALPPIEIIPLEGFYDYKRKYQSGLTREICPAALSPGETARVQRTAEDVVRTLELRDYARVDFILEERSGEFVCLEANTLPGMTPVSLLPQEAAAAGISYEELCRKIVELALLH